MAANCAAESMLLVFDFLEVRVNDVIILALAF